MSNLQKSEVVIARILQILVESGIQAWQIEFEELELDEDFRPFFVPCAKWLRDEGIVRVSEIAEFSGGATILHPVITAFGLHKLGMSVSFSDSEKINLGDAVRDVSQRKAPYAQLGDLVGGILGGFTKSIGS